ncbi:hypothetical protein [Nocardia brasiliensis]|uniref:hypothetical protein n=1 Tax=Nocardia brasiliensis TaxID=37326 RepID=UPI0024554E29|nr:hypothetical protein [Nocardia brasiliensis]
MDARRQPFRSGLTSGLRRFLDRFDRPPPRVEHSLFAREIGLDAAVLLHEIRIRISRLAADGSLTPGGGFYCGGQDDAGDYAREIDAYFVSLAELDIPDSKLSVLKPLPAREADHS